MTDQTVSRVAGAAYVSIILLGLTAEFVLRGPLIHPDSAALTWSAIATHLTQFRLSILADAAMVVADIGLAVALYALLRSVSPGLALMAMILRLMQAAVIAASALGLIGALGVVTSGGHPDTLLQLVILHSVGYDFGLIFFAGSTALIAWLLSKSGTSPFWLPPLLAGAAIVYLVGSITRIIAPEINALIQPAYLVPVIAECAFATTLLIGPRLRAQPAE